METTIDSLAQMTPPTTQDRHSVLLLETDAHPLGENEVYVMRGFLLDILLILDLGAMASFKSSSSYVNKVSFISFTQAGRAAHHIIVHFLLSTVWNVVLNVLNSV